MAATIKDPKSIMNLISSKAGAALWNSLSPQTKKRVITSGLAIITQAAARKVASKAGIWILVGAIVAGAIFIVNNQDDEL